MLKRWISLYLIHILLVISFYPVFLSRYPTIIKEIPIDNSNHTFNSKMNPIWVAQMSDLHISPIYYNSSLQRVNDTFRYITQNMNPTYLLLTGDITDNLDEESVWSPAYPHEEHFKLYQQLREQSGIQSNRLIEILGNHDTWGRKNFRHYYQYFVNGDKMKKNFYVQKYVKNGLRVVSFCPVHFPASHTTYHFIVPMYREMLDEIERVLDEPTDVKYTIFSMHFTVNMMFPIETVFSTRTKRNLKQILSDPKYNIVAMLNGHTHPENNEWLHYGSTIELTSTALLVSDGFNVFSIDNDRINYQMFFQNDSMPAMITCPTPDQIATRIFKDNDFQIRVVSFNSVAKNFDVEIDGKIKLKLKFDRELEGGSSLYSSNVHLDNGTHSITVSGDLNQSFNFSISQKVGPFIENKYYDIKGWAIFVWFILSVIYQVIVLCAEFCPYVIQSLSNYCDFLIGKSINSKIDGKRSNFDRNNVSIFKLIFAGPVITGYLLRRLPTFVKYFVLFVTIFPFIFPVGIEIVEGEFCYWTIYGFTMDGKSTYDIIGQMFGLFYVGHIASAIQYLFCLILLRKDFSFLVDFIACVGEVAVAIYFWIKFGQDSNLERIYQITFQFHLIPAISSILLLLYVLKIHKNNEKQKAE